jgi:hypothetical protein
MTEQEQPELVNRGPCAIKYIENPSEAVQMAAVRQNPRAIRFIKRPVLFVQLIGQYE